MRGSAMNETSVKASWAMSGPEPEFASRANCCGLFGESVSIETR